MPLSDFASTPAPRSSGSKGLSEAVVNFVRDCGEANLRITYGGLSLICLPNPKSDKLNRGQHGSNRAKQLPVELQPVICRANGGYDEKAIMAFTEADENFDAEDWGGRNVIPQDKVVAAFEANQED